MSNIYAVVYAVEWRQANGSEFRISFNCKAAAIAWCEKNAPEMLHSIIQSSSMEAHMSNADSLWDCVDDMGRAP